MTAGQSLKLFQIAQRYFNNAEDATTFVTEMVVENKIESRKNTLSTKDDIYVVKQEISKDISSLRIEMKEQKAELIKWMFVFWIGQITITIAIILLYIKK